MENHLSCCCFPAHTLYTKQAETHSKHDEIEMGGNGGSSFLLFRKSFSRLSSRAMFDAAGFGIIIENHEAYFIMISSVGEISGHLMYGYKVIFLDFFFFSDDIKSREERKSMSRFIVCRQKFFPSTEHKKKLLR